MGHPTDVGRRDAGLTVSLGADAARTDSGRRAPATTLPDGLPSHRR
ncbi:hypothetical protein GN316_01165 [Xylophilus sp. Kf1]|nr:hypothetical protein [Xylophilus sp. Kf1]